MKEILDRAGGRDVSALLGEEVRRRCDSKRCPGPGDETDMRRGSATDQQEMSCTVDISQKRSLAFQCGANAKQWVSSPYSPWVARYQMFGAVKLCGSCRNLRQFVTMRVGLTGGATTCRYRFFCQGRNNRSWSKKRPRGYASTGSRRPEWLRPGMPGGRHRLEKRPHRVTLPGTSCTHERREDTTTADDLRRCTKVETSVCLCGKPSPSGYVMT